MSSIARRLAAMAWSPRQVNPYAWWDAEAASLIALSGGTATSIADLMYGYSAAQAFGSAKPAWSASSFNGRPGLTFDGTDDELTYASTVGIPTGATPFEAWAVVDQNVAPADTTNNIIVGWGGNGAALRFDLYRTVVGGVNQAAVSVGNGTVNAVRTNTFVDFTGRHVVRAVVDGVNARVDVDGVASVASAVVPNLTPTRLRLGSLSNTAASAFWQGVLNAALITPLLSSGDVTRMYAYFNRRL